MKTRQRSGTAPTYTSSHSGYSVIPVLVVTDTSSQCKCTLYRSIIRLAAVEPEARAAAWSLHTTTHSHLVFARSNHSQLGTERQPV